MKNKEDVTPLICLIGFSIIYLMGHAQWYLNTEIESLSDVGLFGLLLTIIWIFLKILSGVIDTKRKYIKTWGKKMLERLEQDGEWNLNESINFVKNVVEAI